MDLGDEDMGKHARSTMKDAIIITLTMIAALMAAEGRMPDFSRIGKFLIVYGGLIMFLKINHNDVARQVTTAAAIGCGSKLMDILIKK